MDDRLWSKAVISEGKVDTLLAQLNEKESMISRLEKRLETLEGLLKDQLGLIENLADELDKGSSGRGIRG